MARTVEGRELTLEHKADQAALGLRTTARALEAWSLLDLANLDASMALWLPVHLSLVREEHARSERMAAAYLSTYRAAEGVESGAVVVPTFDTTQAAVAARVAGPLTVKTLIGNGSDPEDAFAVARRAAAARAQKWSMAGGRQLVIGSARATRRRVWRRVSDGNPCAFCAMLVTRSLEMPNSQPPTFEAHGGCGCTVEEAFVDDPWTDAEAEFVQAYRQAAQQAKDAGEPVVAPSGRRRRDTVLWRMRRNRPDLFSDGVVNPRRVA